LPDVVTQSTLSRATSPASANFNPGERIDDAGVADVRSYMHQLIALDNQFGGTEVTPMAFRLFRSIKRQIDEGRYAPSAYKDLIATAGELAEVTGWLAYDADRQKLAARMNAESLALTRLAGDRTVELLTLQNASMHAGFLGRPVEALHIAESVLDGSRRLSSRIRCLFLVRKARALAQGGDGSALRLLDEASSLYLDGPAAADPEWAWWIDDRELLWHSAMCKADLGDAVGAVEDFGESVAARTTGDTRSHYIHRVYLLRGQVAARSWEAADRTLGELGPLASQVSSSRSARVLRETLASIGREPAGSVGSPPSSVLDGAAEIEVILDDGWAD
jgi:hypothetical protein